MKGLFRKIVKCAMGGLHAAHASHYGRMWGCTAGATIVGKVAGLLVVICITAYTFGH